MRLLPTWRTIWSPTSRSTLEPYSSLSIYLCLYIYIGIYNICLCIYVYIHVYKQDPLMGVEATPGPEGDTSDTSAEVWAAPDRWVAWRQAVGRSRFHVSLEDWALGIEVFILYLVVYSLSLYVYIYMYMCIYIHICIHICMCYIYIYIWGFIALGRGL